MARIIAIDDESSILKIIKKGLENDGHEVSIYTDASQLKIEHLKYFDLILLDIMMPKINGFEFCQHIRKNVDSPIIFLTAKILEEDILYGLNIGGDDYILKPFRIAELRARVNAHLRRENREKHHALVLGKCKFDLDGKILQCNGKTVKMTKSEYLICEYLARHHGQAFSREQIFEAVFDLNSDSDNATISTHIKNIRNKMGEHGVDAIKTVWGIGYKWEESEH